MALAELEQTLREVVNTCEALCEGGKEPLPHDYFVGTRHTAGSTIEAAIQRLGAVQSQLRTLADPSSTDDVPRWTRLETSDAIPTDQMSSAARCFATRVASWLGSHIEGDPRDVHVVLDVAAIHAVHTRHTAIKSAPDQSPTTIIYLSVPSWFLHLFRYAIVTAHEVAHPFTDAYVDSPIYKDKVAELVEVIAGFIGRSVSGIEDEIQRYAKQVLLETLNDVLALHLAGPAFVAGLAVHLIGTSPVQAEGRIRFTAPPLLVRLRTLLHFIERGEDKGGIEPLISWLNADIERYCAEIKKKNSVHLQWQVAVLPIVQGFCEAVIRSIGPAPTCKSPVCACHVAADLWRKVSEEAAKPEWGVRSLQSLPEGRSVQMGRLISQSAIGIKPGPAWEILQGYIRVPPLGGSALFSLDLDALLGRISPAFSAVGRSGFIGAVLGPCDILVLRSGFRARATDDVQDDRLDVPCYLKRRSVIELLVSDARAVAGSDVPWHPSLVALSEIRLQQSATPAAFLARLQSLTARPRSGYRLARLFLSAGWNDLTALWYVADPLGLRNLHEDLLASQNERVVSRSVTQLLVMFRPLDGQKTALIADSLVPWRSGLVLDAAIRTRDSSQIRGLGEVMQRARSAGGVSQSGDTVTQPVFGVDDAKIRFETHSTQHLHETANCLWRAIASQSISRSSCHIRVPSGGAERGRS